MEPTPQLSPSAGYSVLVRETHAKYLAVQVAADTTSPEEAAGLGIHMFQIIRMSQTRGFKWLKYDME